MLEGLVAWVLNNYLGKYVENLNTDQLSVALLSGKVELENLPLKKDALRHLGLPVEVRAGFVGRVRLQVPVRQLRSAPWVIAIDKLYLVAAPVNLDEWDAAAEANYAHERKVALLDALEAQWRAAHEALAADAGYYAASYSSWLSYGTGLLANIAENLQLQLNDVHIRYEDGATCARAFACGLTAAALRAESCDAAGRRGRTPLPPDNDGCAFKLLELEQLAVYWDPMSAPHGMMADCSIPELTERMSQTWLAAHQYLLAPATATARVRRELTEQPLRSRTRPRLACHLTLDTVSLNLTQRQYSEAVGCSLGLQRIGRLREFRALRPAAPVAGAARLWWLYALRCHCPHHTWMEPRPTWASCAAAARGARQYVATCLATLASPAATLPPERQAAKDEFEWRTPLHLLKPLREIAMRKVPVATPPSTPEQPGASGRSMLVQWFPQWWGWYGAPAPPAGPQDAGSRPPAGPQDASAPAGSRPPAEPDLEEEILDVLADSLENNTMLKRDTVFGQFEFVLNKGCLNLCMDAEDVEGKKEPPDPAEARVGLELQFSGVRLGLESRVRAGGLALRVALGGLRLRERVAPGSLFPVLVAPAPARGPVVSSAAPEPLFQLLYEKKPFGVNADYKLWVKSASLEVVYCAPAARWARQFLAEPWGAAARAPLHAYDQTKARLITQWEHMLHPHQGERRSWHVELDVSAPQVVFAEALCERDGAVLVLDLGRLRLADARPGAPPSDDDEEMFMTPCSTPPGSLLSPASPGPPPAQPALDAARLHNRLYDRYTIEFSDLQILVGRARDNWKYAHTKSTSSLHLLDRFSISLEAERRVVHTTDPQYPTATLRGTLPALVVHLSEQKVLAVRAVLANSPLCQFGEQQPAGPAPAPGADEPDTSESSETELSSSSHRHATLFMLQFAIDQMSLEVQSRGRSIAEVQVCGVRVAGSARPAELALALSVHSLLLVDALQTYGPDFELLVASHKHVGMDTASGSIRGSEPTSPTSPAAPGGRAPPPHALQAALYSLHHANNLPEPEPRSPGPAWAALGGGVVDEEALIAVELTLVRGEPGGEDLRIANILFNNLDIIANQETIVELIGFTQRVLGGGRARAPAPAPPSSPPPPPEDDAKEVRTEITFDFHRLGVLLLRAAAQDGAVVAKKIATATVSEARIQATVDATRVEVDGSLGGVQVVSLWEAAGVHTRVLSAGRAPAPAAPDQRALLFTATRRKGAAGVEASVSVRVARVWVTYSSALLRELRSCLAEFKQYLANLARSIRAAAADMAIGLVHPRGDSIYANPKLSGSMEGVSPRRRTTSLGCSLDDPPEDISLTVSIELESPVVVVPRSARSPAVFVAHLGRMSLANRPPAPGARTAAYRVRVTDISLSSVDVSAKLKQHRLSADSMPAIYDAGGGKPVLHNTALQLHVLYGQLEPGAEVQCSVTGKVVGGLHVSARREQYEQLLDTISYVGAEPAPAAPEPKGPQCGQVEPVEPAVPTLRLDPALRAAVLAVAPPLPPSESRASVAHVPLKVQFELAQFTVELRADLGGGERSVVQLAFREFAARLLRERPHESELHVSLHSVTMEDLTQPPESRHRTLMASLAPRVPHKAVFVSKSCPDLTRPAPRAWRSLPAGLNVLEPESRRTKRSDSKCGPTPPSSPAPAEARAGDGLVNVTVHMRDPQHPRFADDFDSVSRLTRVQFNCLKLVVSIDGWVAVLDFFGVAGDEPPPAPARHPAESDAPPADAEHSGATVTEMSIRSLALVLVGARGEVCGARAERVAVAARARGRTRRARVRVGALRLQDARAPLWRDRLRTHGEQALEINYRRLDAEEALAAGHETALRVALGPATYVHTKRFVHELLAFAHDFRQLRRVILQARQKVSVSAGAWPASRQQLTVRCASPVIVLPVSGRSRGALRAELSALCIDNCFRRAGDEGTVSTRADPTLEPCEELEVRMISLEQLSVWCARGGRGPVRRAGPALLAAPARLLLQLERHTGPGHNVPDMTIHGTLTTLQCELDPAQYRLLRGVLAHNLGEDVAALPLAPHAPHAAHAAQGQVWTTSSLKLDLHDVQLTLAPAPGASLACINFIKSRLLLETYSDLGQDIDLVSQEILVSDTRYASEPANRRGNVFARIVQPMPDHRHSVQAEVHARKRGDSSAYTILVNNMRLMAILDWWEAANQFIMQPPLPPCDPDLAHLEVAPLAERVGAADAPGSVELKLNITDSQLVLVEDASVWDTNAVILKSTTVITYRVADAEKPVLCELNELEVFSCVLGLEEETALAIVDPAALTVTLRADRVLHIATGTLNLRLSYHDMRMFASMIQSLPAQARAALSGKPAEERAEDAPANLVRARAARLLAPRWLPRAPPPPPPPASAVWPLHALQVTAECVTLCVIDDCLDSDVPLLEVSLADLSVEQDLRKVEESLADPVLVSSPPAAGGAGAGGGRLRAALAVDYYNRMLSGWEPAVEPWRFETTWEYTLTSALALCRLAVAVRSEQVLCTNVTSSLVELAQLVRANWAADYYAPQCSTSLDASPKGSPAGHRRRSPFVPYALRNHCGHQLWFTTLLTSCDVLSEPESCPGPDDSWVAVRAGGTEPFSFGARRGRGARAAAGAPAPLHQLALRLEGWAPPSPVCVDRVGVFFRTLTHQKTGAEARLVLEVSLEGSARKLVTVRSALTLLNRLPVPVEVRLEHAAAERSLSAWPGCGALRVRGGCAALQRAHAARPPALRRAPPALAVYALHPVSLCCGQWSQGSGRWATVAAGAEWAAPLVPAPGAVGVRPVLRGARGPPAPALVDWRAARLDPARAHCECRAPPLDVYRFCCVIVRTRFPAGAGGGAARGAGVAGHALTLVPALRLENLLPVELAYRAAGDALPAAGALSPADTRPFHEVNIEEGVELSVKLDGFGWSSPLALGGAGAASFTARLKLKDARARRLYLTARVSVKPTDGIKVSVSAAYWLVNRTGLPLVFRAEGAAAAAGQGAEHEVARVVAPLLFAFAEPDAAPTVSARLGTAISPNEEWCSPFGLGPGTAVKRLTAGERVFAVGVAVRAGRGRYRRTNIATLAPRYQLHNNTPYHLQFAQKCTATTLNDPGAMATHVSAVAGCFLPWHWARWERPQLLCVRVLAGAAPRTAWAGGLRVDAPRAAHLACRELNGGGYVFLRAEVVAQGATLFVVLTHADSAPPPLRVDNYSPVAVMFHQVGCSEEMVAGAHAAVQWALPEPDGAAALALRAPGGPRAALPLDALGPAPPLAYQNFIYVAFTASATSEDGSTDEHSILVLEVPLNSTRVILARKRFGDRAQLWRRGPNDQLIHEGSSPPQPTDALLTDEPTLSPHAMVLDIEGPAPRPGRASALMLRRADPRRASTQAWRLLPPGRMACAHNNMCVQPAGGLMALTPGSRVVLDVTDGARGEALPPAQAVVWHTLRPGSGRLSLALSCAGPTRIVTIKDAQHPESGWISGGAQEEPASGGEWEVCVQLAGLSLSLVARAPAQELVHALLSGVQLRVAAAAGAAQAALAVQDMQWDNQLLGTPSPVLLHCLPGGGALPALHAAAELMRPPARRYNALFFKHLVVALRPIAVRLEERLILKLWWWAAPSDDAAAREEPDEADYETRRVLDEVTALHARRYYFALIKLIPSQIRLSMVTASKLERELTALRRRLALTLIRFEDAAVELEPFARAHVFEPAPYLARQMLKHFKDELKWQAAKILGSVDFLGNPLGFVADVSEGVSGLIYEGNVGALLKNVTHGLSNSAAKVTESLGDGLERVVGDEAHEETRRRIRSAAAGAHLAAGFRGLGLGILGGMTSLVKHSYEGAAAEGLSGLVAGVGKGLLGTVTKPVIGVLDLAAEAAAALRDSARRADRAPPPRARRPRAAAGPGGLLPRYDQDQAEGAALLYQLNGADYSEGFLAYRVVRGPPHDIRALLSTRHLRIFTCRHAAPQVVMETHLSNLVSCAAVVSAGAQFVELGVRGAGGGEALRRPRVQCDAAADAAWLAQHAAYARRLHLEHNHTLPAQPTYEP